MVGRECGTDVLGAMAAGAVSASATAEELLARLARRRILERAAPGAYRFAQTLLRDTAYTFTPKAQRRRWHEFLRRVVRRARATGWPWPTTSRPPACCSGSSGPATPRSPS